MNPSILLDVLGAPQPGSEIAWPPDNRARCQNCGQELGQHFHVVPWACPDDSGNYFEEAPHAA